MASDARVSAYVQPVVRMTTLEPPQVVFSTHYDCVPPFFASRVDNGKLYGRGACDAKGILAAQVTAVERLRASGEARVAMLFVAGEERGSDGAKAANDLASVTKFLINGEPTDNRLAAATRGIYRVRLTAHGRAAHSSTDQGLNANLAMIPFLVEMKQIHDEVDANSAWHNQEFSPPVLSWNIGVNVGKAAGQSRMHVHVHLIPRYAGDVADRAGGVRCVLQKLRT